ncbi:hypothetical protein B0T11DRAFT_333733 [Plectosphaerella cucumerina]|uniref:Glycoside hydrolase 131 catalytic N-terminal domain-containing protein n=1 Tax=Plectosphaerella cucumerina TaxID=40658 RepID=A0A8K0T7M1_9PEZI|nr:hypothetical protein B0T11DRAFT_333733 [Plectosphaerella cucumerina]
MARFTLLTAAAALVASASAGPLRARQCNAPAPGGNGTTIPTPGGPGASATCPLSFDGRIPSNFTAAQFDDPANGIYTAGFVTGANLTLSQVILFPENAPASLFDKAGVTKPLEVTINDESIFAPSPDNVQVGFRRTELLIASNSGSDESTTGVKTLHFSVAKDAARPLNLAHEYQLVFLEDSTFSKNQFVLKTGAITGVDTVNPDSLTIFGNTDNFGTVLFTTPFTPDVFHNFALGLDFTANTTQIFYSNGTTPLAPVTEPLPNDISGQGQYHFGVLKKGLGGNGDPKAGTQDVNTNEGILYSGIFNEDSSAGCRTLA